MKERQIPFNGPMVRAVLDGSKTQTRRVVKLPHQNPLGSWESFDWGGPNGGRTAQGETVPFQQTIAHTRTGEIISCPYGQPGDRLWVREAWKAHPTFDHLPPRDIPPSHVWYMADDGYKAESRYRQGMFMPRWASRITLEIVSVRVERLQDISESDAQDEGISYDPGEGGTFHVTGLAGCCDESAVGSYRKLWESINGPGSWSANPWVWAVEFKRITA